MKAQGIVEITKELTLSNPSLTIKRVDYDWQNDRVNIEILFNENDGLFKHSRTFTFDNSNKTELGVNDIYNYIASDDALKNFE